MEKGKPTQSRTVLCPTCKQPALFTPENPYRPFCSKRCRLIDLGQWASETYRVPDETSPQQHPEEGQ